MSDAADLARDLRADADAIDKRLAKIALRGAIDIKDEARRRLERSPDKRGEFAARQISADPINGSEAEVGYSSKFTPLARAMEFGSAHTTPVRALNGAADQELDDFTRAVGQAVVKKKGRAWR